MELYHWTLYFIMAHPTLETLQKRKTELVKWTALYKHLLMYRLSFKPVIYHLSGHGPTKKVRVRAQVTTENVPHYTSKAAVTVPNIGGFHRNVWKLLNN